MSIEKPRFLHIMFDDKFIDYFIQQSEYVAPNKSEYWIVSDVKLETLKYVKSDIVNIQLWNENTVGSLANAATVFSKIFLHGFYPFPTIDFLKKIPKSTQVIWFFWGSEGYKYKYFDFHLYQPCTYKLKSHLEKRKGGFFFWLLQKKHKMRIALATRWIIKRVNICATWVEEDYQMVKSINKNLKYCFYSYFSIEQLGVENIKENPLDFDKIWLGNSSTFSNNHLDAFNRLKDADWKGTILVPLSYGDLILRDYLIQFGMRQFGEKFVPITEFLPITEYHLKMNEARIFWMNHIRQQAAGNIIAALLLGKVVILNAQNNIYKTFKNWGISIFTDKDLKKVKCLEVNAKINKDILVSKFNIINAYNSIKVLYEL